MSRVKMSVTATTRNMAQAARMGSATPQANQRQSSSAPLTQKASRKYRKQTAGHGRSGSRNHTYAR